MAERRVFPAIDLKKSGTRKEELLITEAQLNQTWNFRNSMRGDALEYSEQLNKLLKKTKNNQEFLDTFKDIKFRPTARRAR
jgi:transcription termination factor Rho